MKPANLFKIGTISFFLLTLGLVSANTVRAQSAYGVTAIPPRLEFTVTPGKAVTSTIKVRNESSTTRVITTSVKDYIVTDDKGTPIQIDEKVSNRWSAASWVQISPTQLRLQPGETKNISVSIVAPDNALPGGHYAMVLHNAANEAALSQTGATMQANVGTLLYITVPGAINENARISKFEAPSFSEYGPITFNSTVANFSDIHIAPKGMINITNMLGGQTANLELANTNIFPETSRNYTNILERKWLFGRYKAQFLASYGTTGQAIAATIFFWVIPWKLILLIITIIVLITLIIILNKKKNSTLPQTSVDEPELLALKKKHRD